eukprot:TRINITY_DN38784_c0_g2_i1.p1 TRINITY_DN38784_c0_g2~~TRINITY_DN38784_c0_g2_i1.p1  ORF type:complete len:140 (+),score=25.31 TRINITY_DN38784_c0_g2_i1:145-564(+)
MVIAVLSDEEDVHATNLLSWALPLMAIQVPVWFYLDRQSKLHPITLKQNTKVREETDARGQGEILVAPVDSSGRAVPAPAAPAEGEMEASPEESGDVAQDAGGMGDVEEAVPDCTKHGGTEESSPQGLPQDAWGAHANM